MKKIALEEHFITPYKSSMVAAEFIKNVPLSDAVKEKIAYKNAARILQLS